MEKVFKLRCNNLVSMNGCEITLSNSIRYLGVYLTAHLVTLNVPSRDHLMLLVVQHQKKLSSNY